MQLQLHTITIEDLVPADHFLRKLDAALDLSFIYEMTASLYSGKYGRPPIDPVVLVKYLLVGFLYAIPSERQIELRIQTDVALRWYLGLDLFDVVPDHSTISQLRRRKPKFRKIFRRLFEEVVRQCIEMRLVSGRLVATDSTHIRANASRASEVLVEMPEEPGAYYDRLDAYDVIPIQAATADAAYDFPLAHEVLSEHNITFYVRPQARFDRTQVELKRDAFSYDPEGGLLPVSKRE